MPVIGTFSAVKDGYAGSIRTLMLNGRVSIIANDRKATNGAPDFRISLGNTEIGAAWRKTKQGTEQSYLRVRLDDPAWAAARLWRPSRSDRGRCRATRLEPPEA